MLVELECPKCKGHICERYGLNVSNFGVRLMYCFFYSKPGFSFYRTALVAAGQAHEGKVDCAAAQANYKKND